MAMNFIGEAMNEVLKWKNVKCPYCNDNTMIPFFGYDCSTKKLITLCCKKEITKEEVMTAKQRSLSKSKEKKRKKIWVCLACGKRSNDLMGENPIDRGWDVSCMMNSTEVYENECIVENGRVKEIKTIKIKQKKNK